MKEYPRLLVLSNNSFSKSNSNGRTLGSLLQGWPKDRIAQFCLSTDGPDFDVCTNYYCITDGDMLRATLRLRPARRRELNEAHTEKKRSDSKSKSGPRKSAFTMICRNLLWALGIWRGKNFWQWVDEFSPDVVLIQSGDSYFMHNLAIRVTRRFKAKVCMFNTEAYCFFKSDYLAPYAGAMERVLFPVYNAIYKHQFGRFMKACDFAIHGNSLLKIDYDRAFNTQNRSDVIYTASDLRPCGSPINIHHPSLAYIGNLGVGRHKNLIRLANELRTLDPTLTIDVYGATRRQDIEDELRNAPGINYHGFVSYDKVKEIIAKTDVLVHVELPAEDMKEQLRYAFTTKIADSLSSGRVFLMIAPDDIACGRYIKDSGGAIYAQSIEEAVNKMAQMIDGELNVDEILRNSAIIAQNHNPRHIVEKFRNIICQL